MVQTSTCTYMAADYLLDIHSGIRICLEDEQKNSCKTGDIFEYLWICDYAGDSNRYSGRSGLVWNPEFYGIHGDVDDSGS